MDLGRGTGFPQVMDLFGRIVVGSDQVWSGTAWSRSTESSSAGSRAHASRRAETPGGGGGLSPRGPGASTDPSAPAAVAARGGKEVLEKGLENDSGQNHCFLNAAIQAFWNLQTFRERFLIAPEHLHDDMPRQAVPAAGAAEISPRASGGCDRDSACAVASTVAPDPDAERCGICEPADGARTHRESCCFCALRTVFSDYQHSEADTLPPDILRNALSAAYDGQGRFQLGDMEDATETIEALLDIFHENHVYAAPCSAPAGSDGDQAELWSRLSKLSAAERAAEASERPCTPPCVAHEVFGIEYLDLPRCTFCSATEEPVTMRTFLYRVYVADLLSLLGRSVEVAAGRPDAMASFSDQVQRLSSRFSGNVPQLPELLRRLCQREVGKKCVECNSLNTVVSERWLTQTPRTFVISLVWPCSTPTKDSIWLILATIPPQLSMDQLFCTERSGSGKPASRHGGDSVPCMGRGSVAAEERTERPYAVAEGDQDQVFVFRGLICYFGMHYIALFWCWSRMRWIIFDDQRVIQEKDWSGVANFITTGQYVPTLLFYEVGDGPRPPRGVQELERQVQNLEDRQSQCSAM